jgi:thioredoxin reductase (NADPH)
LRAGYAPCIAQASAAGGRTRKSGLKLDCLVVGAGPAGLTAAVYLGRYRRHARVIESGASRAALIPTSHNYPGFPEGIHGPELLRRLRLQALRYGADIRSGTVESVEQNDDGAFVACVDDEYVTARTVLLATGVVDIEPQLPDLYDAIQRGLIRHCPICDGYEVIDEHVAVIGQGAKLAREAVFIRRYTPRVTAFAVGDPALIDAQHRSWLGETGIRLVERPVRRVRTEGGALIGLETDDGEIHRFDSLYSALGEKPRSQLAMQLGARCNGDGQILCDEHMQTSVPGLYAAGDVVCALNQISVATGHAAIAATAIHRSCGVGPDAAYTAAPCVTAPLA